ncbi:exocyst complex component EXO70H1-like [Vicia villosa]|uniref:exocyst complex component EXO70H1-like n=1 Tax=Vicia villosa TaxID=3911 RepID=UPI00273AAF0E|nr:exocyst complex component EXO70H1-like [Vicia villosa]
MPKPRSFFFFKPPPPKSPPPQLPPSSPQNQTFSDAIVDENIETAHSLITKWNSISTSSNYSLFTNSPQEAKQYLNAVKRLQYAMMYLIARDSTSQKLIKAQSLMKLAMKKLETEFYRILSHNRNRYGSKSLSVESTVDRQRSFNSFKFSDIDDEFSDEDSSSLTTVESNLKAIAECMIFTGYSKECANVYVIVRKSIMDEALYNLGVEKVSFSQVQKMDWEFLEWKIKCWINAVKVAVNTLFPGERILCNYIFDMPETAERNIAYSCFTEICKEGAIMLFGFPENVAKCKNSPEKMFRILDLYEAISDNVLQIESLFASDSTSPISAQVITSELRLGESVRTMLTDFESAIQKETSKIPVPGGGIHPLTRYVMNYISLLNDYSDALSDIFSDWPQTPLPESYYKSPSHDEDNPPSEISKRLSWLILSVLCKLDGKSELYKDIALSYLFLANNMQYVVVKVRNSNLGFILGEDWLTKHEMKVKEYVSKYERMAWSKVLSSIPENPTAENASVIFQNFNLAFEEACRTQCLWVVPDPRMRDEIKESLDLKVVDKYREFYMKYRVGLDLVVRYSPEDLKHYLSEILCGSVLSHSRDHFKFKVW